MTGLLSFLRVVRCEGQQKIQCIENFVENSFLLKNKNVYQAFFLEIIPIAPFFGVSDDTNGFHDHKKFKNAKRLSSKIFEILLIEVKYFYIG